MKRNYTYMVLALLLISTMAFSLKIRPARGWTGIVSIQADGSIDPPAASISRYGNLYVLENDIIGCIKVERNDSIIDGSSHTLRGSAEVMEDGRSLGERC